VAENATYNARHETVGSVLCLLTPTLRSFFSSEAVDVYICIYSYPSVFLQFTVNLQLMETVNLGCICIHNKSSRCVSVYIFRKNKHIF